MVGVFCDGTAFAHFVPDPEAAPPQVPTASSVSLQTLQNEWDALVHLSRTHCMGVSCVRCHAPNRFGTVNMEDNVNIKRS